MTIVIFFLVLGILVLAHELGHFLVAKRNGVEVEEFGFGFPPRLVGTYKDKKGQRRWLFGNKKISEEIKNKEETIYSINLLPFGGFVKITGENGEEEAENDPRSFSNQPLWVRFKILVAGVLMNFLLAIVFFSLSFWLGVPKFINDDNEHLNFPVTVVMVSPKSPAAQAGFQIGDKIFAVISPSGEEIKIKTIEDFVNFSKKHRGQTVKVKVKHPQQQEIKTLTVKEDNPTDEETGAIGVALAKTKLIRYSPWESLKLGFQETVSMTVLILVFLGKLIASPFTHQHLAGDITGPIGIAKMTGQAARVGLSFLLRFVAMLSVNLAVINLLPFPGLDGGRILFLLIEKIKGSPLNQKIEGRINTIGFIILLILMVAVIIKDIHTFF